MQRAEQKEKRRREILDAGLDLFIRKGYAATRTADIAKAVGMSEGLLFHYFETKEKLYTALLELAVSGKDEIFSAAEVLPVEFFENTAKTILNYISKNPFAAKLFVLMSRARYEEAVSGQVKSCLMRKNDIDYTAKIIKKGKRRGGIRKGDPVALAIAFFMAVQGVAENMARYPEMPVPDPEWLVDIVRSR